MSQCSCAWHVCVYDAAHLADAELLQDSLLAGVHISEEQLVLAQVDRKSRKQRWRHVLLREEDDLGNLQTWVRSQK